MVREWKLHSDPIANVTEDETCMQVYIVPLCEFKKNSDNLNKLIPWDRMYVDQKDYGSTDVPSVSASPNRSLIARRERHSVSYCQLLWTFLTQPWAANTPIQVSAEKNKWKQTKTHPTP